MSVLRRGDVVLVAYPFSEGIGAKLRPAVVVQSDDFNRRLANTIIVQVTTNLRRASEPTQFVVDPASEVGASSGLLSASAVSCSNLATVPQERSVESSGRSPPAWSTV